jgi:hypothetical protein
MKLIEDWGSSLQREISDGVARIEAAVGRHSKQLSGAAHSIAGLEEGLNRHDELIRNLQERLRKLENKGS